MSKTDTQIVIPLYTSCLGLPKTCYSIDDLDRSTSSLLRGPFRLDGDGEEELTSVRDKTVCQMIASSTGNPLSGSNLGIWLRYTRKYFHLFATHGLMLNYIDVTKTRLIQNSVFCLGK